MKRPHLLAVFAGLLAVSVLSGCYGQTDYASRVGLTSATLNGRGTANDGPAQVYFEYWRRANPSVRARTPVRNIPAGASGPVSERVAGLPPHTPHEFRLCGSDSGESPVCAQTRTLYPGTRPMIQANGDTAAPAGQDGNDQIDVDVVANPLTGYALARHYNTASGASVQMGARPEEGEFITCFEIAGNVAVIGFRKVPLYPAGSPFSNQQFATLVDGGPAGSGRDRFSAVPTPAPESDSDDCVLPEDPSSVSPLRKGDVAINVPPSP